MDGPKKKTRSFRVSDPLWEMVETMAAEQAKKPSAIITEALASHVGEVIRRDRSLSNQQITGIMSKVERLEDELSKVRNLLLTNGTNNERKNENTS